MIGLIQKCVFSLSLLPASVKVWGWLAAGQLPLSDDKNCDDGRSDDNADYAE